MIGALAGYAGGGSFILEQFDAKYTRSGLESLRVDLEDLISGDEIDFFEDTDPNTLEICDDAQDTILEFHDYEEWEEAERLLLQPDKMLNATRYGDMLIADKDRNPFISEILERVGVTAGPRD